MIRSTFLAPRLALAAVALAAVALAAVVLAAAALGQTAVQVRAPEGDVTVTTDQAAALAGSVIESSLRGVGRMLGAMRGTDPGPSAAAGAALEAAGDVEVAYDDRLDRYLVRTADGARIVVDGRSGEHTIELHGAGELPGALIEESLAAVGSMIRGLRTVNARRTGVEPTTGGLGEGPLGLSSLEVERLTRLWRAEGISEAEVERRREGLEAADAGFRAAMRALDDSMEQLDRQMEALEREMEALDRKLGGGDGP